MVFSSKDNLERLGKFDNLGIIIDNNLNMMKQIPNTVRSCNHQLRNFPIIKKELYKDPTKMLIQGS